MKRKYFPWKLINFLFDFFFRSQASIRIIIDGSVILTCKIRYRNTTFYEYPELF